MIRKTKLLKEASAWEPKQCFPRSQLQARRLPQVFTGSYLDEMQHGEGEMLVTETAVHHHLDERQQRARQLSKSKHHLVR